MTGEREEVGVEQLLAFVKESRGFDFTGYKRSSLQRRVGKRMREVGVESHEHYIEYLELHPREFANLFNAILINVTGFFRDPEAWNHLRDEVLPGLIASRSEHEQLRVWCAGVASGEEAYSAAMTLVQLLGEAGFRERVKIYATDIDESALDHARHAAYTPRQVEDVPPELLERFFDRTDQRYVFRQDLRRCVIFGRNDLVQDAPISHLDLLICRNTLMYFTAETQAQILRRFNFALDDQGVLVLGRSEMLVNHGDLFTPVDLKLRVFRKLNRPGGRERMRLLESDLADGFVDGAAGSVRDAAFDVGPGAQLVVDIDGVLVLANERARELFSLGANDIGRPLKDLEVSYRPVELRSHLDLMPAQRRPVEVRAVRARLHERERVLDVRLMPLIGRDGLLGSTVTYLDVTETHALTDELLASKHELEHAYQALQSTNEELETTNEELQSTNEELETTNEELQSTNEELETMNEELQSSNEELETMNEELRARTDELNDVNAFLETILTTIGVAVAVVDRNQHVQLWSAQARELWGLTADEVEDQDIVGLDIGLPLEQLKEQLRTILAGDSDHERLVVDATNRRGQRFQCAVTLLPLRGLRDRSTTGAIVMMESVPR